MSSRKSTNEVSTILNRWMDVSVRAGNYGPLARSTEPFNGRALRDLRRGVLLLRGDSVVGVVPTDDLAAWLIRGPLLLRAALETLSEVLALHLPDRHGTCGSCGQPSPCATLEQMRSRLIREDQPASPPSSSPWTPS